MVAQSGTVFEGEEVYLVAQTGPEDAILCPLLPARWRVGTESGAVDGNGWAGVGEIEIASPCCEECSAMRLKMKVFYHSLMKVRFADHRRAADLLLQRLGISGRLFPV